MLTMFIVSSLVPAMKRSLCELDVKLKEYITKQEAIDLHPISAALTLNVIGRTGAIYLEIRQFMA
jgi:hypothetical protein